MNRRLGSVLLLSLLTLSTGESLASPLAGEWRLGYTLCIPRIGSFVLSYAVTNHWILDGNFGGGPHMLSFGAGTQLLLSESNPATSFRIGISRLSILGPRADAVDEGQVAESSSHIEIGIGRRFMAAERQWHGLLGGGYAYRRSGGSRLRLFPYLEVGVVQLGKK